MYFLLQLQVSSASTSEVVEEEEGRSLFSMMA
jgi:hypothetical protein